MISLGVVSEIPPGVPCVISPGVSHVVSPKAPSVILPGVFPGVPARFLQESNHGYLLEYTQGFLLGGASGIPPAAS